MIEKPTVTRGSSEAKGSWKMNWMLRRSACSSRVGSSRIFWPPNSMAPL